MKKFLKDDMKYKKTTIFLSKKAEKVLNEMHKQFKGEYPTYTLINIGIILLAEQVRNLSPTDIIEEQIL